MEKIILKLLKGGDSIVFYFVYNNFIRNNNLEFEIAAENI